MTKSTSTGFAPIAQNDATLLVLGSMPSVESLKQQQYYAHARNAFWPIMASTFQFSLALSYQDRCTALIKHKVAVWDVLQSCQRQGSLDSNIKESSIIANNFAEFLQQHPAIKRICFNGAKAEHVFNRHVLVTLSDQQKIIARTKLPSSSPAHASMRLAEKQLAWAKVLQA